MLDSTEYLYDSSLENNFKEANEPMVPTSNNIVDQYLDCGLDNFELYLSKKSHEHELQIKEGKGFVMNDGESKQTDIEKRLEKEVEEAEEHKPKVEK
jgi:hypothetical protein